MIMLVIVVVVSGMMFLFVVKDNKKSEGIDFLVFMMVLFILGVVFGEMVWSLCFVFEEIKYKYESYWGNWKDVCKSILIFNNFGSILVVVIVLFFVGSW